jgi:hypothetical protein
LRRSCDRYFDYLSILFNVCYFMQFILNDSIYFIVCSMISRSIVSNCYIRSYALYISLFTLYCPSTFLKISCIMLCFVIIDHKLKYDHYLLFKVFHTPWNLLLIDQPTLSGLELLSLLKIIIHSWLSACYTLKIIYNTFFIKTWSTILLKNFALLETCYWLFNSVRYRAAIITKNYQSYLILCMLCTKHHL